MSAFYNNYCQHLFIGHTCKYDYHLTLLRLNKVSPFYRMVPLAHWYFSSIIHRVQENLSHSWCPLWRQLLASSIQWKNIQAECWITFQWVEPLSHPEKRIYSLQAFSSWTATFIQQEKWIFYISKLMIKISFERICYNVSKHTTSDRAKWTNLRPNRNNNSLPCWQSKKVKKWMEY